MGSQQRAHSPFGHHHTSPSTQSNTAPTITAPSSLLSAISGISDEEKSACVSEPLLAPHGLWRLYRRARPRPGTPSGVRILADALSSVKPINPRLLLQRYRISFPPGVRAYALETLLRLDRLTDKLPAVISIPKSCIYSGPRSLSLV